MTSIISFFSLKDHALSINNIFYNCTSTSWSWTSPVSWLYSAMSCFWSAKCHIPDCWLDYFFLQFLTGSYAFYDCLFGNCYLQLGHSLLKGLEIDKFITSYISCLCFFATTIWWNKMKFSDYKCLIKMVKAFTHLTSILYVITHNHVPVLYVCNNCACIRCLRRNKWWCGAVI